MAADARGGAIRLPLISAESARTRTRPTPPLIWRSSAIDLAYAAAATLPLLLTAHLPLYDLPNHIAMLHVLLEGATNPTLSRIYGVHWAFVPNMGLQVFAWLLSPFLTVEASVRLFCIATVLLLCLGTRELALALDGGRKGLRLYRLAPFLVWGGPMQFGFITYCFGVGLMLCALALYLRLRRRSPVLRIAVLAPVCIVLLATHLMAYGLFLAAVAGWEIAEAARATAPRRERLIRLARQGVVSVAMAAPALTILLLAPPLRHTAAPHFAATSDEGFSPFFKAESLAAITWFAMPLVEVPLLLAAAACAVLALWRGWIRLSPRMAITLGLLALVWLALPRGIKASFYVDYRVPWAICFVALAGLAPGPVRVARPAARQGLAFVLAALVAVRIGSVCVRFLGSEPDLAAIDHALATLPEGTSLWLVKGTEPGKLMKTPPLEHSAAYVVLRRNGFESEVFAGAAGQMVYLQPPYLPLYRIQAARDLLRVPDGFGAVLVLYPELVRRAPGLAWRRVVAGPDFELLVASDDKRLEPPPLNQTRPKTP